MGFSENAKWIWCSGEVQADEYGDFVDEFVFSGKKTELYISADSNYVIWLNGKQVSFGQYADFPYDKVYDRIDITNFCQEGKNRIAVCVWYYGIDYSSTYCKGNAGLIYSVVSGGVELACSGADTRSRISPAFINHAAKRITSQLGISSGIDLSGQDDWKTSDVSGFSESFIVDQTLPLRPRPCKRLSLGEAIYGREIIRLSENDVVYDLGEETVGFLTIKLRSDSKQKITVGYGEHIVDGKVREKVGGRDFTCDIIAVKGINETMNPFRRLGARYLQLHSEFPVQLEYIGICPTFYELEEKQPPKMSETQRKIYDMCVRTLKLCMHEHYEDCPWREQALYAMDSRNQMLCGYYAFGETEFPRANLELMSKSRRPDSLLPICSPVSMDFAIPSFSLHYINAVSEYLEYSNDREFVSQIYARLCAICQTFEKNMKDGILLPLSGDCYWNFYEWTPALFNDIFFGSLGIPNVVLNSLFSISLRNMAYISDALGIANDFMKRSSELSRKIKERFFDDEKNIFYDRENKETYSQLGNSLALLCAAVDNDTAIKVCELMKNDTEMTKASLSMVGFVYDAMIKTDKERYRGFILSDIESRYSEMLAENSTCAWETEKGQSDFSNAGSLCHGWSAMPIYYYHTLLKQDN